MFPAENLRGWRGQKVIDNDGERVGELEAVYVDTATDEPAFVTFAHYDLPYAAAVGERRLGRR